MTRSATKTGEAPRAVVVTRPERAAATMKILVISNLYPPHVLGGYEILCGQVCEKLRARGHDVSVLTTNHGVDTDGRSAPEDNGPIRTSRDLRLYLPFGERARLARRERRRTGKRNYDIAREAIDRARPDMIFVWSQLRLTLGAARAALDSGLPVAFTMNDMHVSGYTPGRFSAHPKALLRYAAERWLMPEITLRRFSFPAVTCISHQLKADLVAAGVSVDRARVIHQGIPIERFPCKEYPGRLHDPVRVLYVGQLHHYKGVHTLIQGVMRAGERIGSSALRLDIAGDGPCDYKAHLRMLAERSPVRVEFLGKVSHENLPALYRERDLFVFPSEWAEPFGLTHLEAMASGLPVVSTTTGGHGEFLDDERNCLAFPKGDAAALADRIVRIVADTDLTERIAREGRRDVAERYTIDRYVTDLESFLADARGATGENR